MVESREKEGTKAIPREKERVKVESREKEGVNTESKEKERVKAEPKDKNETVYLVLCVSDLIQPDLRLQEIYSDHPERSPESSHLRQ